MIARDQEHFKLAFLVKIDLGTWDRFVPQILCFPSDNDFLFNPIWGKTGDGDENVFGLRRNAQAKICPIRGIEHYM